MPETPDQEALVLPRADHRFALDIKRTSLGAEINMIRNTVKHWKQKRNKSRSRALQKLMQEAGYTLDKAGVLKARADGAWEDFAAKTLRSNPKAEQRTTTLLKHAKPLSTSARAAHLAEAFFSGKDYKEVELTVKQPHTFYKDHTFWGEVERNVLKFGAVKQGDESEGEFQASRKHLEQMYDHWELEASVHLYKQVDEHIRQKWIAEEEKAEAERAALEVEREAERIALLSMEKIPQLA